MRAFVQIRDQIRSTDRGIGGRRKSGGKNISQVMGNIVWCRDGVILSTVRYVFRAAARQTWIRLDCPRWAREHVACTETAIFEEVG